MSETQRSSGLKAKILRVALPLEIYVGVSVRPEEEQHRLTVHPAKARAGHGTVDDAAAQGFGIAIRNADVGAHVADGHLVDDHAAMPGVALGGLEDAVASRNRWRWWSWSSRQLLAVVTN